MCFYQLDAGRCVAEVALVDEAVHELSRRRKIFVGFALFHLLIIRSGVVITDRMYLIGTFVWLIF